MSTTTTTEYVVTGMTCGHCVNAVSDEVSHLPGVVDVDVDLATGSLTVVSHTVVPFPDLERAVEEAGYSVAAR
ncbi:MAG TPA: heavy metal-associated domain-containing protein [Microlunatus sp.]